MIEWLSAPFTRALPTDLSALALAMVWGQKEQLSPLQYQMFRTTGLLHLLVLSGQNITLLVNFAGMLTRSWPQKFRLLITFSVACFYLLVFGGEPPIVRASLMAILSSFSIISQSTTLPLYLLLITSLGMLAYQPEWLNSLSFQLSIGATGGILLFYPYFSTRFKLKNQFASTFFLSLSAQIFTTPLILLNFRQVSLLTLPVNTLAGWLVEPIMMLGVLLSIVGNILPFLTPLISLGLLGFLKLLEFLVVAVYPWSDILTLRI